MKKKILSVLAVLTLLMTGAFATGASASGASETTLYTDASSYGSGASTVDVTLKKSTSGSISWTMVVQEQHETGNWYTQSGTTKTGYVSSSSPSYRSYSCDALRSPWPHRIKVTFSDGTSKYSNTFYVR